MKQTEIDLSWIPNQEKAIQMKQWLFDMLLESGASQFSHTDFFLNIKEVPTVFMFIQRFIRAFNDYTAYIQGDQLNDTKSMPGFLNSYFQESINQFFNKSFKDSKGAEIFINRILDLVQAIDVEFNYF